MAFWSGRPEVNRIWASLYTPQLGEQSPEMLGPQDREAIARELPALSKKYPKLLINESFSRTIPRPPNNPGDCLFSKMSANYSADLKAAWNLVFSAGHRLLTMRLRHQQRVALGEVHQAGRSLRAEFYYCGSVIQPAAAALDAASALDARCVEARCQPSGDLVQIQP